MHCRLALALALVVLSLAPGASLLADGFIYIEPHVVDVPHPTPQPRPRRIARPQFPLRVTRHHVTVEVDGNVARTRVDETFHNPNPRQLEGTYLFPLPPGASISNFAMSMNGKIVDGEVLERDKARSIYESIVRQIKDPGLLEYVDRGLFKARVFPIPANGDVRVQIDYDEQLRADHGHTRYHYPLDTGKYSSGDYNNVLISIALRTHAPIRTVNCPTHSVDVARPSDREARVSFEASRLTADEDFILDWNVGTDALAPMLLTHRGSDEDRFFLLSVAPSVHRPEPAPPKDLVIVLDTSGSMLGPKMDDARRAVKHCVHGLNEGDRFNIVDFSSEARKFRDGVVEATPENRASAVTYIDGLKARGGTHVEEALRAALTSFPAADGRLQIVVLIGDGEPTLGLTRPDELTAMVKPLNVAGKRIFCFGVGVEVDTLLLDRLASENRGTTEYVLPGEQLEIKLSNFYDKIDHPVLTNVAIDFRGLATSDVYPKPLPDLFSGDELVVLGRFRDPGRHTVLIRGTYLGKEQVLEYSLDFTDEGPRNDFLPRMWAARKVGYLLEAIRLHGENPELRDEIVHLSKRYGILTPYTSYLIVEDESTRQPPATGLETIGAVRLRETLRGRADSANAARPGAAESAGTDAVASDRLQFGGLRRSAGRESIKASDVIRKIRSGELGEIESFVEERVNRDEMRMQQVAGKTFYYMSGDRWVDSAIGSRPIDGAREVVAYSDEYFELLREHPGIGRVLSVGDRLAFLWEGQVIVVRVQ